MNDLKTRLRVTLALALASGMTTGIAAQQGAGESACAQLLPAIESLKAMLDREARARAAADETQRMQVVMTLLGLRYRNIEALESALRTAESEENDIRGAVTMSQAQLETLDEAAKTSTVAEADLVRKAQRAGLEAALKGFEERARGLRERRGNYQGQLALERRDIEKLEAVVRGWLEKTP